MSQRSEVIRIIQEYLSGSKKITELPSLPSSVANGDLFEAVRNGVNYQVLGSQLPSGGGGGAAALLPLNPQSGDYQLLATDIDFTVGMDSASPQNLTIPLEATESIPLGSPFSILQVGTSVFTLVPEGGVTVNIPSGATLDSAGQGTFIYLIKTGTNEWYATGTQGSGGGGGGSGTVTSVGFTGGLISVANPTTTPAFTVAGTSGGIPYFSGSATWASSAALAANAIVIGGGAGVAPSTTTTGTGVITALGINVGSIGAFLPNNLANTNIFVGNGSGIATAVAMSSEATMANTGAVTLLNAAVIGKVLTGYTAGAGTVAATDTILQAIQKLGGNDALNWKLASGGSLTGNNTITGAFSVTFNLSSTTSPFNVTGAYTVPAGVAISAYLATFGGTLTSKGTANDGITGVLINSNLANSTGGPVTHVGLRIAATATGSTTPAAAVGLQVLGLTSSATINEIIQGADSAGTVRFRLRTNGAQIWTTAAAGTDFGGSIASPATNTGHWLFSLGIGGSATINLVNYFQRYTGGLTTGATGTVNHSIWDNRAHVIAHTGAVISGYLYDPSFSGAQSGTETNYAFRAASGLSGFGITTPTARLQTRGLNNAVAFLAEDDSGSAIASFGETGGAKVIGFFGATPVVRQTMGAATAGVVYSATEQAMIQAVYDAVRNIGIGT